MRKMLLVIILLLLVGIVPTAAQEDASPLLQMLARIPAISPAPREYMSYIDYHALLTTREGVPEVHSWAGFQEALDGENGKLLIAAFNGAHSGPDFLSSIMAADDIPGVLGFDFFDVDQAVTFGNPPANVVMLQGDFDQQAIIAAHEARDYTKDTTDNGLTLLCSAAGCENGKQMNLQNRNPSNLFGGLLGRNQPVLLGDGWIASSAEINALVSLGSQSDSLADQPDFRAAAEAITANGTLIQSYFIDPGTIASPSDFLLDGRLSAEQATALREQMEADFVPMPAYNLAVLADVVAEDEQQAVVALVYTNQADAEAAAALYPDRLTKATSFRVMRPFSDVIADRGVTSTDATVYAASNDRYVVLVTLHAPLPGNTPNNEGQIVGSSLPYGLLVDAYLSRDLAWLAPVF